MAAWSAAYEGRKSRLEALGAELASISEESVIKDPSFAEARLVAVREESEKLSGLVRLEAEFNALKSAGNRKQEELAEQAAQLEHWKAKEASLRAKKASLLSSVQDAIVERANVILAPATVDVEVRGGRYGGGVFFSVNMPGGSRVPACSLSGGELVEMQLALSAAILGQKGGIIICEASELDDNRANSLVQKSVGLTQQTNGAVQVFIVGHNVSVPKSDKYDLITLGGAK
jgi:DNA repair exonuclease SbcCD ATPase subunit